MRKTMSRMAWCGAIAIALFSLSGCGGGDNSSTENVAGNAAAKAVINGPATGNTATGLPPGVQPDARPGS